MGALAGVIARDHLIPDGAEVVFCGPWLGELGVEMVRWVPYLRSIKGAHPEVPLVASGYANSACLYRDFADEFWVLDDSFRATILNRETSFNSGVFHEVLGNTAYREHAARKGLGGSSEAHRAIGEAWFRALEERHLYPSTIVTTLGEQRAHRILSASNEASERARALLERAGAPASPDRLVMLLPRLRLLQGEERSWSPRLYTRVIAALSEARGTTIAILGSREHEGALSHVDGSRNVINLIGAGLDLQIAFWELASLGSGPPSGGLVPGYLTRTPLLHWYKPGHFPTRHGQPWNEAAEPDYEVFGIKSEWIEVTEDASSVLRVVEAITSRLGQAPRLQHSPTRSRDCDHTLDLQLLEVGDGVAGEGSGTPASAPRPP